MSAQFRRKDFVEFLMVQLILFRIFWDFVAIFIDKNDSVNFLQSGVFVLLLIIVRKACVTIGTLFFSNLNSNCSCSF